MSRPQRSRGDDDVRDEAGPERDGRGDEVGRRRLEVDLADGHDHEGGGGDEERDLAEGALRAAVEHADVGERRAGGDDDEDRGEADQQAHACSAPLLRSWVECRSGGEVDLDAATAARQGWRGDHRHPGPVRVVQLGGLMPFVREWLSERWDAPQRATSATRRGRGRRGRRRCGGPARRRWTPCPTCGRRELRRRLRQRRRRPRRTPRHRRLQHPRRAHRRRGRPGGRARRRRACGASRPRTGSCGRGEWAAGREDAADPRRARRGIGILGLGRIGPRVAERLEAFGAEIGYHARTPSRRPAWTTTTAPRDLAVGSDVLVVAAAGGRRDRPAGRCRGARRAGAAWFPRQRRPRLGRGRGRPRRGARGGPLAGAGLDVFADEPHVPQALLRRDDVVLLPHLASGTVETRAAMVELVLENVEALLTRGHLVTPV